MRQHRPRKRSIFTSRRLKQQEEEVLPDQMRTDLSVGKS